VITPVSVLTGFLGSGKTTLLARLVRDPRFADTAIIVNEWGEAPIDHALLREASGEVVALAGGCICCRAAGDVVRALRELYFQRAQGEARFARVVIETTGLADPAPLLATLVEMPVTAARYSLSGVIATVDATRGMETLDAFPEALRQVATADRIVVTKVDEMPLPAALENRLRMLAPGATVVQGARGEVDPATLFDTGLYRGPGLAPDLRGWLRAGEYRRVGEARAAAHDPAIASFAWNAPEPLAAHAVERALRAACELLGERILRLKGVVRVEGQAGPTAVHAVGHTLYPFARLAAWPDEDRSTRIVVIGRGLEDSAFARIFESFLSETPPRSSWQPPLPNPN